MTDIIERSREIAYRPRTGDPNDLTFDDFLDASAALLDAADEIERTRQDLQQLMIERQRLDAVVAQLREKNWQLLRTRNECLSDLIASEKADSAAIKEAMDASQIEIAHSRF